MKKLIRIILAFGFFTGAACSTVPVKPMVEIEFAGPEPKSDREPQVCRPNFDANGKLVKLDKCVPLIPLLLQLMSQPAPGGKGERSDL